ncbi:AAA family ATPase [Crateriforma conspicua]|uniref:Uncharacterized protein n=1 Tax=Crateriforma conspicua TaxID=2527996 RepID=A0A5C5XYE5_9PLAN|nr:AAA family ATPase [Crateriforma conspicua]TWT68397.1 hypothetical protein Pan14r_06420 [Crateriforma conspicua]
MMDLSPPPVSSIEEFREWIKRELLSAAIQCESVSIRDERVIFKGAKAGEFAVKFANHQRGGLLAKLASAYLPEIFGSTPQPQSVPADESAFRSPEIHPGTLVKAADRDNVGTVVDDLGHFCAVRFVSQDGNVAEVEIAKSMLRDLDGVPFSADQSDPIFKLVNAEELETGDFKIDYLIPGVLAGGQNAVLAGQFKTLKTSVGIDLALSLASGTSFLEQFPVAVDDAGIPRRRKVLFLTAESGLATIKETCLRVCEQRLVKLAAQRDYFTVTDRVPQLCNLSHVEQLMAIVKDNGFEVVVADPAYLMLDGERAGNVFAMGEQLRIFADIAAESDATPILIHHATKNNLNATDYQPLELKDLAWAGFAEFARQWLLLSRRERYAEGSGEHRLWLSVGGSAGHNGCWGLDVIEGHPDDVGGRRWEASIDSAKNSKEIAKQAAEAQREQRAADQEQKRQAKNRDKVVAAFRGIHPPRLTMKQIRVRGGLKTAAAEEVVGYMMRIEELKDAKVKAGNNQEYDGFELVVEQPRKATGDHRDLFTGTPGVPQ